MSGNSSDIDDATMAAERADVGRADMLVNSESAAKLLVEHQIVEHISPQRFRQLAGPADKGGDPDFPDEVPTAGRGHWYRWAEVADYFRDRTVSRVPRRWRPAPTGSTDQAGVEREERQGPGPSA
jgi:hypothetical protein